MLKVSASPVRTMGNIGLGCVVLIAGVYFSSAEQVAREAPKSPEAVHGHQSGRGAGDRPDKAESAGKVEKNAYSFQLPGPDGKAIPIADYKGKVLLLVNLGRNSSYNDQLPALIKLNEHFKEQGLVVIGVPSNEFGAAEPGTDVEIQKAYKADGKVPFLVTARSVLTGDQALPLYEYLTKGKDVPAGGDVHWNYTKFIIDRKGKVIARLDPDVAPDSPEMMSTLDQIFDGRFKPKPSTERPGAGAGAEAQN